MNETSTRAQIVEAADGLFYRQGYARTSFADIAGAVKISRGNFYFHFKSKDRILDAVIDARLGRTQHLLARWEAGAGDPAERIRNFIRMVADQRGDLGRFGCPVGTLCAELSKVDHPAQGRAAGLFSLYRGWLGRQFEELGCGGRSDALAMHLLGRSQGIAVLGNAFRDEAFIRREATALVAWLDEVVGASAAGTPPNAPPRAQRPKRSRQSKRS